MSTLSRCDDCYAQVEPLDWYGHREWHKDQEDTLNQVQDKLENIHDCECDPDLPKDVTKLDEQMQDVFNWVENEIFPRLEKVEDRLGKVEDLTDKA